MSRRLVIPTKAGPDDLSDIYEGLPARYPKDHPDPDLAGTEIVPPQPQDGARVFTWQEIAEQNGCVDEETKTVLIENLGSQWCLDNDIDGLGIATEKPPPPPEPEPTVSEKITKAEILEAKVDLAAELDPASTKASPDERIARLEKLVAGLLDGRTV